MLVLGLQVDNDALLSFSANRYLPGQPRTVMQSVVSVCFQLIVAPPDL